MPEHYQADTYGEAFADVYDDWYSDVSDIEASTRAIVELAQGERVLELGIGTGRLALPLAAAGLEVHGVDASTAMLDRLRQHDLASRISAVAGDMSKSLPDGPFTVIFVAYNTFFNLVTEQDQRSCLQLVADRLAPHGFFAIEAFVPDLTNHAPDRGIDVRHVDDGVVLNVTIRRDDQTVHGQQVHLASGAVKLRPWQVRYLSPEQLDELTESVGLRLAARWSDWDGGTQTDESVRHVSLYTRDPRSTTTAPPAK
ncbi:MAG: class I SAM-dependent DNA methyltransferase [Acidimicrobiales bacterium]|jgi:SAM-dependent methyltransferase